MKNKFMRKVKWFAKPEASEPLNYLNFGFADVCHFVGLERIIVNLTDVLLPLVCTPLCILLLLDFASWKCTGMFFPILLSVTILNLNRNKVRSGRRQRHEKTKQSGGIKLLPHSAFNSASAQNTVQKKKKKKNPAYIDISKTCQSKMWDESQWCKQRRDRRRAVQLKQICSWGNGGQNQDWFLSAVDE